MEDKIETPQKVTCAITKDQCENTSTLILAAGEGLRLGGQPKAFIELDQKPLIQHVTQLVSAFSAQVIVGVRPDDVNRAQDLLGDSATVVAGGASRQQTVEILLALADREMVLIHDVARPFASSALYSSVLRAAFEFGGAAPALRASKSDSVAMVDGDWLGAPLPRDRVVRVQTPCAFTRESLVQALRLAKDEKREETAVAALLSLAGYKTRLIDGDPENVKITYIEDLQDAPMRWSRIS